MKTIKSMIVFIVIWCLSMSIFVLVVKNHKMAIAHAAEIEEITAVCNEHLIDIYQAGIEDGRAASIAEEIEKVDEIKAVEETEAEDYSSMINPEDVKILANVVYGEARGLQKMEKAAVVWCILNRLDNGHYGKTITEVVTAKGQFTGYNANRTYTTDAAKKLYNECREVAFDVLNRYYAEKAGVDNIGRVLPKEYLYFTGDGKHNNYKTEWSKSAPVFTWTLESPYDI